LQAKLPLSAISGYATMGLNWEIFNSFSKYQSKDLSFQQILPMYMLLSKDLSHVILALVVLCWGQVRKARHHVWKQLLCALISFCPKIALIIF
jgi:hypothetical protein